MSKALKWILGIFLALVIVAALFAVGVAWRMHTFAFGAGRVEVIERNWDGPMMKPGFDERFQPPMQRGDGGYVVQAPMMYERGFAPYHSGFFMLGGLVKLFLFFGLLYGAYWLGRRNARIVLDPKPVAPVEEVSAPEADPASAAPVAETTPAPRKRAKKE